MIKQNFNNEFTDYDFIRNFFILLHKYGVHKISVEELRKKLFYYYENFIYKDIFQDIARVQCAEEVDLSSALESVKFWSDGVCYNSNFPNKIFLAYDDTVEVRDSIKCTKIYELLDKMAKEFALRYKIEQASKNDMNIYATSPNRDYVLLSGNRYDSEVKWEMITDGNINKIYENYDKRIYQCDNPYYPSQKILLMNQNNLFVNICDASYAVMQGKIDNCLVTSRVYTESTDFDRLQKISEVASTNYDFNKNIPFVDRPYVKQLIIK